MADLKDLFKSAADQSCFLASDQLMRSTCHFGEPAARSAVAPGTLHADARSLKLQQEAEKLVSQYCSFPEVRRHPRQASLESQSRAWLSDLYSGRLPRHRVQRLLDTRLDTLGSVVYPTAAVSDARSLTLVKLIHWFFILDDVMDDPHLLGHDYHAARRYACLVFRSMFGHHIDEAQAAGLLGADGDIDDANSEAADQNGLPPPFSATGGAPVGTSDDDAEQKYAASLAKAQQELAIEVGVQWASEMQAQGLSRRQVERLREAVAEYLLGVTSIVRLRQEKRLPSLEEYIHVRRMDGANKLYLLGCEFDLGIELDDATLQHPLMQALRDASSDHLLWINDLLSFNREYHNEDYVSLLAVLHCNNLSQKDMPTTPNEVNPSSPLQDHHERPALMQNVAAPNFQDALTEARRMIRQCDCERVHLAREIASWRPDLQLYVAATHYTISGVTFWTLWSSRYQTRAPI